jgi:hypothetical protein
MPPIQGPREQVATPADDKQQHQRSEQKIKLKFAHSRTEDGLRYQM